MYAIIQIESAGQFDGSGFTLPEWYAGEPRLQIGMIRYGFVVCALCIDVLFVYEGQWGAQPKPEYRFKKQGARSQTFLPFLGKHDLVDNRDVKNASSGTYSFI